MNCYRSYYLPDYRDSPRYLTLWGILIAFPMILIITLMTVNVFYKSDEILDVNEKSFDEIQAYLKEVNETIMDTNKAIFMVDSFYNSKGGFDIYLTVEILPTDTALPDFHQNKAQRLETMPGEVQNTDSAMIEKQNYADDISSLLEEESKVGFDDHQPTLQPKGMEKLDAPSKEIRLDAEEKGKYRHHISPFPT